MTYVSQLQTPPGSHHKTSFAPFLQGAAFDAPSTPQVRTSIGRLFNLEAGKTLSTATLKTSQITVTHLCADAGTGMSSPIPIEKAYIAVLQLQDSIGNEFWKSGQLSSNVPFKMGSLIIAHLEESPAINLREAFDFLLLHIPEIVLDELADDYGMAWHGGLRSEAYLQDTVLHHLARAALPSMENSQGSGSQFFEYMARAICLQLMQNYGTQRPRATTGAGALDPARLRLAKDLLAADLTEQPHLDRIAQACGVSVGRFVRSFREATGLPPYRWLRSFRVERAKELLFSSSLSLAQIAYECGFADQSHFTRVFAAAARVTPAAWRRARRG